MAVLRHAGPNGLNPCFHLKDVRLSAPGLQIVARQARNANRACLTGAQKVTDNGMLMSG